jgi:hypothetical protein
MNERQALMPIHHVCAARTASTWEKQDGHFDVS